MVDEFASSSGCAPDFDRLDKTSVIFGHAVHGFLNQLGRRATSSGRNVLDQCFCFW
jgi:hypothetical protein